MLKDHTAIASSRKVLGYSLAYLVLISVPEKASQTKALYLDSLIRTVCFSFLFFFVRLNKKIKHG